MLSSNAYLAIDRRFSLAEDKPLADRTSGTVLLADISGFTSLTNTLAKTMGSHRGPEEQNIQINNVFNALINVVRRFHGSVISFGGDAITCWFEGDDGSLSTACALLMQSTMKQFQEITIAPSSVVSIRLKVAVVQGSTRRFVVGNKDIQLIDVLAGQLLDRLAAAEQLAEPDEVIVGAEIVSLFGDKLSTKEWRDGENGEKYALVEALSEEIAEKLWPSAPELSEQLTQHWVLAPVFQRLSQADGHFLSELRPVSPIFVNFTGIDYDNDPNAQERLDQVVQWLQGIAERYEGHLIDLSIGDKGSYCEIVFGAMILHEDDTVRAVAAAQDMLSIPAALGFLSGVKVGVSRGMVHAGAYGGDERATYGINGEDVNLSARLMSTAEPGQVLVSPAVAKSVAGHYEFQQLSQTKLKGFDDPLTPYSLVSKSQIEEKHSILSQDNKAPVAGRQKEREILLHALRKLQDRHSQVVLIEGEAGIGKSRLMTDLVSNHDPESVYCLHGAGSAIEISTAYHAWRPVFRSIFAEEIHAAAHSAETFAKSVFADDQTNISLAPLLNVVLPFEAQESALTKEMSGSLRAFNTNELLTGLLKKAAAKKPLLILMEDAHWLDSASWGLLNQIRERVEPMLLVVASREMKTKPREYERLQEAKNHQLIRLDTLDRAAIEEIISSRLGASKIPVEIAKFIHEKAAGNPFFSEELAFALRDKGLITVSDGLIEIKHHVELDSLDFPDTIQGVIISRIDQLPATPQLSIKIASIIGRIFGLSALCQIHPSDLEEDSMTPQLDALAELDLVSLESLEPEISYFFKHIITQEVAYNLLTFSQRRNLHREAAQWYESFYAQEGNPDYPVLVHHWSLAEVSEKAIEYMDKAGAQALQRGAFREAIRFVGKAYELSQQHRIFNDDLMLAQRQADLGIANLKIGNLEGSRENLAASLQHLNRPLPDNVADIQKGLKKQVKRQYLHRLLPFAFLGSVKDEQKILENLTAARAYEHLGQLFYHANDPLSNLYTSVNVLNLAEQIGPSPQLTRAYGQMTLTTSIMNKKRLSKMYSKRAMKSMSDHTPLTDKAMTNEFVAIAWAGVGRWAEANALSVEAMQISERIGDYRRWNENISMNALTRYPLGDVRESLALREQLYKAGVRDDDIQIQGWGLLEQAEIAIHQQRYENARGLTLTAAELGPVIGRPEEIWLHGMLANIYLNLGQLDLARSAAQEAFNRLSKAPPTAFYVLEGYAGTVEAFNHLALETKNPADAQLATDSLHHLKRFSSVFSIAAPRAHLWQGVFELQQGQQTQALATWKQGLERAEKMGMLYEAGLLNFELGQNVGDSATQQKHMKNARTTLTQFDASTRLGKH